MYPSKRKWFSNSVMIKIMLCTHGDAHKTEQLAAGHGHYDVAQNILCRLAFKSLNFVSGRCIEVSVQRV